MKTRKFTYSTQDGQLVRRGNCPTCFPTSGPGYNAEKKGSIQLAVDFLDDDGKWAYGWECACCYEVTPRRRHLTKRQRLINELLNGKGKK